MWFSVTTALVYMLTASVFFALSGVAVHGLGSGGWDIALLSRALFGLPFAIFIFLSGPKAECHWSSFAILLRSTSAVIFLAMLYFILEFLFAWRVFHARQHETPMGGWTEYGFWPWQRSFCFLATFTHWNRWNCLDGRFSYHSECIYMDPFTWSSH